jgi:hypothetical protein
MLIFSKSRCLLSGLFCSGFLTKIFNTHQTFLDWITPMIFGEEHKLWSSSLCSVLGRVIAQAVNREGPGSRPGQSMWDSGLLHTPPISSNLICHQNYIWWRAQSSTKLLMQIFPFSCHFLSLRTKFSSQHPVLKHSQSL